MTAIKKVGIFIDPYANDLKHMRARDLRTFFCFSLCVYDYIDYDKYNQFTSTIIVFQLRFPAASFKILQNDSRKIEAQGSQHLR